ncbi:MAG: TIGR02147 family protein [Fibrobacteria bacterium]|nr:TIGR02147 family protein [Fibrobacteria bacterium]
MSTQKPIIYQYLDYRKYLSDYYNTAKNSDNPVSFRDFATLAGVKAPNFLQWLIEGKRNLANKTIPGVISALELSPSDGEYFKLLVLFNQSKTVDAKKKYFEQLVNIRKVMKIPPLEEMQLEHYSAWYNEAIRELLNHYQFNPNEKWAYRKLGKQLCPAISEKQARSAIKQMLKLGLLKTDSNGFIVQSQKFISTGDEVQSFMVRTFHQTMIKLAEEAQDRHPKETRDVSSLTMSISDNCFELIKKETQEFRKRLMEHIKMDKDPDNVYQMNFQLFPLTPIKKK